MIKPQNVWGTVHSHSHMDSMSISRGSHCLPLSWYCCNNYKEEHDTYIAWGKQLVSNQVWILAWQMPPPLVIAKVLVDAVGYVCLASVKYDDSMCQILGDELTISLVETLMEAYLITLCIFVIPSQTLTSSIKQYNCICYDQNLPLHCPQNPFCSAMEEGKFTQRFRQLTNQPPALWWLWSR